MSYSKEMNEADGFSELYDQDLDFSYDEDYSNWDEESSEEAGQRIDPETGEIIGVGKFTVEDDHTGILRESYDDHTEPLDEATEPLRSNEELEEELLAELYGSGALSGGDLMKTSHPREDEIPSRPNPVPPMTQDDSARQPKTPRKTEAAPSPRKAEFIPAETSYSEDFSYAQSDSATKSQNASSKPHVKAPAKSVQESPYREEPSLRHKTKSEAYSYLDQGFGSSNESSRRESFNQDYSDHDEYSSGPKVPESYGRSNSSGGKFSPLRESLSRGNKTSTHARREFQDAPKPRQKDFTEIPPYEWYRNDGKLEYETGFHKDEERSMWEDYSTDDAYEEEYEPSFSDRIMNFFSADGEGSEETAIKRQCILVGVILFIVLTLASQFLAYLRDGDLLNVHFTFNIPWILLNDGLTIVGLIVLCSIIGGAWRYVEWRVEKANETGEAFTLSNKGTYGTARFATREDLKGDVRFGVRNRPVGIPLCIDPETGDSVSLTYESGKAKHVCVTGLSGSGKGTLIKAQVMSMIDHGWSYVIADPSGDIYRSTSVLAEKAAAGYDVYVFNLNDLSVSDGWNPLSIIQRSSQPDVMATSMANSIILNAKQPGEKSDSFYDANELNLLAALMLYVSVSPLFKGKEYERSLGTVYDMLAQLAETGELPEMDELPSIDPAKSPWNFFKNPKAEKLQPNFVTGLNAKIHTLGLDPVREVLSHDEIDLKRIGQKPTAVYVLTSVVDSKFRFLLSLFFTSAFQQLIEYGDSKDRPEMDNPVYFVMDEFASIGVIPNFMQILANVRKYDIGIEILFQDINQIRQVYGRDDSGSIISNCGKRIVYEVNDAETAKEVSGRTGEATIKNTSLSESINPRSAIKTPSFDQKQSTSDGKRNLLTPDEIMTYTKKSKENMLLISEGKPVFKGKKYRYWYHWLAEFVSDPQNIKPSSENVPEWAMNQKTIQLPRTWGGSEVPDEIKRLYQKPKSEEEAEEQRKLIERAREKQEQDDKIKAAEEKAAEEEHKRQLEESERREAEEFAKRKKGKVSGKGHNKNSDAFDFTKL